MTRRDARDLLLLSAFWGMSFLLIKWAGHDFPPVWVALLRSVFGALVLLLAMLLADVGGAESGGGCIFVWSRVVDCSLCTAHCMEKGDEDRGLTPRAPSPWPSRRPGLSLYQHHSKGRSPLPYFLESIDP